MNSSTENIFRLNTKNPEAVICIADELLEMKNSVRCDLLSSISANEFSLALLDRKQNKFLALEVFQHSVENDSPDYSEWLNGMPGKSILLKNFEFKTVTVSIANGENTLVPSALFRKEDAEKYFQFNFNNIPAHIYLENVRAFDMVNVFSVPPTISESVNHLFDNPSIHHHSTALLEGLNLAVKKSNEKLFMLNVRNGCIDIVVTEGRKLILMNSFSYNSVDDLVYYVMFVCDRLQLNPENIATFILGEVEKESAVHNMLYKYIRNIRFVSRKNIFDFSYAFKDISEHFYFDLFSIALCES